MRCNCGTEMYRPLTQSQPDVFRCAACGFVTRRPGWNPSPESMISAQVAYLQAAAEVTQEPNAPSLQDQFESLLDGVWRCERDERLMDRILLGASVYGARLA